VDGEILAAPGLPGRIVVIRWRFVRTEIRDFEGKRPERRVIGRTVEDSLDDWPEVVER
jgi:hypothetical protein